MSRRVASFTRRPCTIQGDMALPKSDISWYQPSAIDVIKDSEMAMVFCVLAVLNGTFNLRVADSTVSNAATSLEFSMKRPSNPCSTVYFIVERYPRRVMILFTCAWVT